MVESSGAVEGAAARASGSPWLIRLAAPSIAIPLLIAIGLALFVLNLGGYPFYTKGEPREAVTVYAMVHGGGIILPLRAGIEVPSKPPLMHWIAALASLAAGSVSEGTVRLPSAISAIGGVLLCYLYLRILFDGQSALLSALILATSFQYLQAGTGARVDMTLTFFMEVGFFEILMIAEGLSRRWLVLWGALALAVLSKGPVGLVLPALTALVWIAYQRRWNAIAALHLPFGIPIVLVIDGGWYLSAAMVRGPAFVHKQLMAENLFRLLHSSSFHEGHAHPFYYLLLALLVGFMPWMMIAPVAVLGYLRSRSPFASARIHYLVAWCLVVLAIYSLAQSKRGVYLLAMYPALAALFGVALASAAVCFTAVRRWVAVFSVAAGLLILAGAAAGAVALVLLARRPEPIAALLRIFGWTTAGLMPALTRESASYRVLAGVLAIGAGAAGISLLRRRPRADRMVVAIAAGISCFVVITDLIVVPAIAETTSLRGFTRAAMAIVDGESAAYLGGIEYEVAFYSEREIPVLGPADRHAPRFLFCWQSVYDSFTPQARARYAIVLTSNPTELDGTGTMLLLRRENAPPGAKSG
ncbi:MAG TPA: glycosyltransferase family 39 protein [Candidatus Binataceae bacterium]|nr:glycosyltransferase family 39 protein [Candidatus Binataceae bacterium]